MIKKVNDNDAMVQVPEMTLKALKGLLFNDKDGIDINPIVEDLSASYDNKDLCAINVALTFKGMKPEICQKSRYQKDWRNEYYRYDFVSYSLILGLVKVVAHKFRLEENGDATELGFNDSMLTCKEWLSYTTNAQNIVDEIRKK